MQDANRKAKKSNKTDLKTAKNLASLKPKQATGDQNTKTKPKTPTQRHPHTKPEQRNNQNYQNPKEKIEHKRKSRGQT